MNIGEILIYVVVGLIFIVTPAVMFYRIGQSGLDKLNEDGKFNSKETPDAVFVRGTKGLLLMLGISAFLTLGLAYEAGGSDGPLVFTTYSLIIPILITPMLFSYLLGIYTAYLAAKNRIKDVSDD